MSSNILLNPVWKKKRKANLAVSMLTMLLRT